MTALLDRTWQVGDLIGPLAVDRVTRSTLALFAYASWEREHDREWLERW